MLLVSWCRIMDAQRVPLAIHENVIGFDRAVLEELLSHEYDIVELRVSPSDVGFSFLRRPRLYYVLVRRRSLRITRDIGATYLEICRHMHHHGLEPTPAWPWQASAEQVLAAENVARKRRGMGAVATPSRGWAYLLSGKQQQYVREQESRWKS